MIELTRLNGKPIVLNSDLIKTAEASPDTMLTLINGEKLIVREQIPELVQRVMRYRSALLASIAPQLATIRGDERIASLSSLNVASDPAPGSPKSE